MEVKLCLALVSGMLLFPGAALAAPDRNHDGLPDRWEHRYHLNLRVDQSGKDQDRDGVRNLGEWSDHTSPRSADSDRDGVSDGADAAWDHVARYDQLAGYGGPLAIERADGTVVRSFFGEKADLRCAPTAAGPFTPCGKQNLAAGTPVADAAHALNQYGNDVWTVIDLVTTPVDPPAGDEERPSEPPASDPAPEQRPAPPATGVVDSFDAGSRVLVVRRPTNDELPSGPVTDGTQITCLLVKDGKLAGVKPCSTDDLVPGAQFAMAQRGLVDGVWTWTKLQLLVPGS